MEAFLLELLAAKLDPQERAEVYLKLHERCLQEAESLCEGLAQAGERYWGAVAALLYAVAEKRGMPHYSHRDYALIIGRLYKESKAREIVVGFSLAERLSVNFYHDFIERDEFDLLERPW